MQTLKEYCIQHSKLGRFSIPREYESEINSYTKVDKDANKQGCWYKVYYAGTDSKYYAFMICPDTKEWRHTTFEEFYGGSIVD